MPEPQTTITGDANVVGDHSTAIKAEHVYVYPSGGPEARVPAVVEPERPAFRVLTVVARPLDQSALPEIGDAWSLADRLAQVQAPLELAFVRPPTVETLRRRMAEDWDVVHFDGHGVWAWTCTDCGAFIPKEEKQPDPSACPQCGAALAQPAGGYLAFEQEDGLMHLLPATEMADLLCPKGAPPRARLAILTACQSAMGAPSLAGVLLAAGVPAVLGMRETVTVGAAGALLPPFYANLGTGRTPRQALEAALPALRTLGASPLSGTPWVDLPVLDGPGVDTSLCEPGCHARTSIEREPLVGVPAPSSSGAFYGDLEPPRAPGDPPGGRKGYLVRLAQALARGEHFVALTGVGGIGKSALAAAAARRLAWRYPGGVFWVDGRDYLETGLRLEQALAIFGHVYGEDFAKLAVARQRELALAYLRRIEAPALIVVDNADVAGEDVFRFLHDVPGPSAVLVTTRTAPEYGGCVLDVEAMTPREGRTFLEKEVRHRKADPRWMRGIDNRTAGKLAEMARLLDGHALALLQAAAQVGSMGLDYALTQVQANPARGETARRFDFSYEPLDTPRKELLHRLAAFAADFDLRAIQNLCTHPLGEEQFELLADWDADLPELVRGSFVERHSLGPGYDRFRLHPVMREYLRHQAGAEPMAVHERRMARHFTALADWGGRQLGDTETALQAVMQAAVERANLLAAQRTALTQGLWGEAISLAYDLNVLFERSGHWADRRQALEAGIEAAQKAGEQRDQAGLAHNLGWLAQNQGDYAEARRLYQESLDIKQHLGDRASVATTLHQLGILAQAQGDYAEARQLYGEAAETFEQLGARREQASVLHQLGLVAQDQGDYTEARRLYQGSLDIEQQLGNHAGVAQTLHQLGALAQDQGDYAEARHLYQESLNIAQQLGNRVGVAHTLGQMGNLAYAQGDLVEARRLYEQVRDISQQIGDRWSVATALHQLGVLVQEQGDYGQARRLYQESLEIKQQLGNRAGVASTLHQLGVLAQDQGDYDQARRLYQESLNIAQQLGDRASVATTLHQKGILAQDQGDYAEAHRLYQESLEIDQQLGNRAGVAINLAQLALLEETGGNIGRARDLIRQAEAIFIDLNSPYATQARQVRERLEHQSP
jgi:tetratricopeptide (TPR) repeat protein